MKSATFTSTIRCAVYTRKSTEEGLQQEFNSLDAQRESAEAYIRSQAHEGWALVDDHFDDGGFTGGNMDRPALKRLMTDIEAGKIDCVVVYKVDRLSRSLLDFARMMETFERHRVAFVSVTQQFNTTTSMGRLMLNVLLSFAQFEREIISERTRDKIAAARRKGKWSGGMPLLGYDVDPRTLKLVVNPAEAEQVRAIYDLYLDKQGLLSTAEELAHRGWTTKRWTTRKGHSRGGRRFDKASLHKLLTNVTYLGKTRYKSEVHEGEHEAIVSPETWQRVQTLLRGNVRSTGSRLGNHFGSLLKGLLHCKPCGCRMSPAHATKNRQLRYRYYVCTRAQQRGRKSCPNKSLSAEPVERFVIERLRELGADSDALARLRAGDARRLAELERACRAAKADVDRFDREVAQLRQQLEANNGSSGSVADGRLRQLEVARQSAAHARAQFIALQAAHHGQEAAAQCWQLFDPGWQSLDASVQASVLRSVVERVEYDGPAATLTIRFKPGPVAMLAGMSDDAPTRELTRVYQVESQPFAPWRRKLRLARPNQGQAPAGRLPRITRLMALALRFGHLVRSGEVTDYATLAELGHVSRARITQLMNLLHLAPDIQEEILFLPHVERGKDSIHLRQLQPIASLLSWQQQRSHWSTVRPGAASFAAAPTADNP